MNWDCLNGKFLVIDGPDGSGKSTQIKLLDDFLQEHGHRPLLLRDPGGTDIGEQIRNILLDPGNAAMSLRSETLLYMASRAQLYHERIAPALKQGRCVVCDRWISSTYAYQAIAGKIGKDTLLALAEAALERTWPDLTIIIDVPSDLGLTRVGSCRDRMEQKSQDFHRQVRDAFGDLARMREDFRIVDGASSIDQVHQRVVKVLIDYVNT